eukprot:TRINITY_DN22905_c0_g1_i1.p1 TRINITY_DN22905_c0_g1~~TRINITY_DN22905_c0_g1_i1.p1  ORF type:complete len:206 (-),score=27.46 TRINITY_DN22905_c0_g1_i1:39-656(-)
MKLLPSILPSRHPATQRQQKKITSGKFERVPYRYSEELNKLVSSMLRINSDERPSVDQLLTLPLISLRIKEKELKENYSLIRKREEEFNQKLKEVEKKFKEINIREKQLAKQEENLKSLEHSLTDQHKNSKNSTESSSHDSEASLIHATGSHKNLENSNRNLGRNPSQPILNDSKRIIRKASLVHPRDQTMGLFQSSTRCKPHLL